VKLGEHNWLLAISGLRWGRTVHPVGLWGDKICCFQALFPGTVFLAESYVGELQVGVHLAFGLFCIPIPLVTP
jgi:hypothetical protein